MKKDNYKTYNNITPEIRKMYSSVFSERQFPDFIFNNKNWNTYLFFNLRFFFEFNLSAINNFIEGIGGETSWFILPSSGQYLEDEDNNEIYYLPHVIELYLKNHYLFVFEKYIYRKFWLEVIDFYLIGTSCLWGAFYDSYFEIFVFGFDKSIETTTRKYLSDLNDHRLFSLDETQDECSVPDSQLSKIQQNYSNAFSQ